MARYLAAACNGMPTDIFFPLSGQNNQLEFAKAICKGCPVKDKCLQDNLHEQFGVWGGTSERQRKRIRKEKHVQG